MEQEQMMQQLQQLVMAAMQGDQQAQQQIMQVKQAAEQGDQQAAQIMQVITQIIQSMQGEQEQPQQPQMARHGAKLAYIKSLQGCPEGTEALYFAKGGKVCKKCVETAKCGNKMKKAAEGADLQPKSGNTKTVEGIRSEIKKKKEPMYPSKSNKDKIKNVPESTGKRLQREYKKNGYSFKGWTQANVDSLQKYNNSRAEE